MKLVKNTMVLKPILDNTCTRVNGVAMEIGFDVVTLDNHMVVIKVQVCKNTIEDVLLVGGFKINILQNNFIVNQGCQNPNLHLIT